MYRLVLVLFITLSTSGCILGGSGSSVLNECRWDPSSCMYQGGYEEGEEQYARDEAARLNRQQAGRVSRW